MKLATIIFKHMFRMSNKTAIRVSHFSPLCVKWMSKAHDTQPQATEGDRAGIRSVRTGSRPWTDTDTEVDRSQTEPRFLTSVWSFKAVRTDINRCAIANCAILKMRPQGVPRARMCNLVKINKNLNISNQLNPRQQLIFTQQCGLCPR